MARPSGSDSSLVGRRTSTIKAHNLRAILLALLHQRATSRVRLAQLTGLSNTAITNLVDLLLAQGIIVEEGRDQQNGASTGRPPTLLQLAPSSRYALGVHIGIGTFRAGVVDLTGQLCVYLPRTFDPAMPVTDVLAQIAALCRAAIDEAGIAPERLVGIGVGASGLVDAEHGINVLSPNLAWRDVPIGDILSRQMDLPTVVDNNVRGMALAEAIFGVGRAATSLAFVYGRVGVGAGFVIGNTLYRGSAFVAGEIGHMTIIPAGGALCRCGNTGCLETLVSETEIVRQAEMLAARTPDSILAAQLTNSAQPPIERVFAAARMGDQETLALLNERAHYMGTALANLINLMNPDMIVLGGLFAAGHDLLLSPIAETMRRRSFANLGHAVDLRVTDFGPHAGVMGAATLALDTFFFRQQPCPLGLPSTDVAAPLAHAPF
jgi:glucokinase-like ROK family protein